MMRQLFIIGSLSFMLAGCLGGDDQQDLTDFINETKRRPKGEIDPLPVFAPYEAFSYSASRLRNPFDSALVQEKNQLTASSSDIKPDFNRPKELLENYNMASLKMVGTFEKGSEFWVLIDDGAGQVHPIQEGNYLGKNFGRIVRATNTQIDIIEIVTDGLDGWVERPRTLKLKEKE